MADNLSAADRSRTMRAVKSKRTGPERRLRAMLAGRGIRGWRANAQGLAGNPDIVFPLRRVVVFIDGCFWHGCPECKRPLPRAHASYWRRKIAGNVTRDRRVRRRLAASGWRVVRVWEHELTPGGQLLEIGARILKNKRRLVGGPSSKLLSRLGVKRR